jgi:hypothetical protein
MLCLLFGLFVLYGYLARGRSPPWALAALIWSPIDERLARCRKNRKVDWVGALLVIPRNRVRSARYIRWSFGRYSWNVNQPRRTGVM